MCVLILGMDASTPGDKAYSAGIHLIHHLDALHGNFQLVANGDNGSCKTKYISYGYMLATAGMNTTGAAISRTKKTYNFKIKVLHCQRKRRRDLVCPPSFPCNTGKNLLFWSAFSMRNNFPNTTLREILRSCQYTLTVVQKVVSFKAFTTVYSNVTMKSGILLCLVVV